MILIPRYDCFVANEPTSSVDYKVRYFDIPEDTNLKNLLTNEETEKYLNKDKEEVEWRFTEIMAVDWEPEFKNGEEIIGFITGKPTLETE